MSQQGIAIEPATVMLPRAQTADGKPADGQKPEAFLMQMGFAPLMTQAVYVAAKLGIPDLLKDGPRSITELAAATKQNERALYRLMRTLASVGVFQESEPKVFAQNQNSEPLRSDVPNSMRNRMIFMGEEWHWRVYGDLAYSIETGKPAWGRIHGAEVFDYFAGRPQQQEIFNRAMTEMSASTAPAIVEGYDFSGIDTIADIAGGHGYLLAQILKANPEVKGILFDVFTVIDGAGPLLEQHGVTSRVTKVAGNFFESIPGGADAYLMKSIIHDWDDVRSAWILRNIHQSSKSNIRVLLVEAVVPEGNEQHFSKIIDLEMLVSPGGVERTAEEYRTLLAGAGFKLTRIIPTKSAFSIIEAIKV